MKKEKTKEENPTSFKEKFKAFRVRYKKDLRFNAFVKLAAYMTFFLILVILINVVPGVKEPISQSPSEEEKEPAQTLNYREILDDYQTSNKNISIKVTGTDNYIIDETIDNGVITGTIETTDNIIKFIIKEDQIYELKMGNETLNETLLDKYDILFIKPKELVTKLNEFSSTKSITEEKTTYTYKEIVINDILFMNITLTIKENKVISINAQSEKNNYELSIK